MFVSRGGHGGARKWGTFAGLALVFSVVLGSLVSASAVAVQATTTMSIPVTSSSASVSTVPLTTLVSSPSSVVSSSSTVPPVAPVFLVAVEERTYDGAGVLVGVATTSESGVVRNVVLGWDPLEGSGQLGGWSVDGVFTSFVNGPLRREAAVGSDGVVTRFGYDALGNTVDGFAVGSAYDAFGRPSGVGVVGSSGGLGFGLRGELTVNGLTHLRARDYDASTGQFLSVDPLESPVGSVTGGNPYHYVGNDPLNYVDPSGMGRICDGGTGGIPSVVRQWGCENPLAETAVGMLPGVGCAYSMAKWEGLDVVLDCVPGLWSKMKSGFKAARGLKRAKAARQALPGLKSAADDLIEGALKNTNILNAAADEARIAAETERAIAGNADEVADGAKWVDGKAAEDAAAVQNVSESAGEQAAKELGETAGETAAKSRTCPTFKSFSGETLVLMADGTSKPMSEIVIGDKVLAYDPVTEERGPRVVTHLWLHDDILTDFELANGESVSTTEDHPFWNDTNQAWEQPQNFDLGDNVLTANGTALSARGLKPGTARWAKAYNLTVEGIHTFYVYIGANPTLVHNANPRIQKSGGGAKTGIIYVRDVVYNGTDVVVPGTKEYVGQSLSDDTFKLRKAAETAASRKKGVLKPGQKYRFRKLEDAVAIGDLDMLEESWIRAGGGTGGLDNARVQIKSQSEYLNLGGSCPL
jgi:RHS repeat-associated protein